MRMRHDLGNRRVPYLTTWVTASNAWEFIFSLRKSDAFHNAFNVTLEGNLPPADSWSLAFNLGSMYVVDKAVPNILKDCCSVQTMGHVFWYSTLVPNISSRLSSYNNVNYKEENWVSHQFFTKNRILHHILIPTTEYKDPCSMEDTLGHAKVLVLEGVSCLWTYSRAHWTHVNGRILFLML